MNRRPDATDKHVGKRVRMRRLMLKMTQEELAGRLRLTYQQLQKYETGANETLSRRHVRIGLTRGSGAGRPQGLVHEEPDNRQRAAVFP